MKKLTAILILFLSFSCFSQSEAVKIDEFGRVNCEDLLARIDNLAIQMRNNPDAKVFLVLHPQPISLKRALYNKVFIDNVFRRRGFDLSRLKIVRGKEAPLIEGEFYLVPAGAHEPTIESAAWPDENLDLSKPFIFGDHFDEDPCGEFPLDAYAELIRSNSNIRAHIVIFPYSKARQKRLAAEWLKILTVDHKIPRHRLRVFFGKQSDSSLVQFWIVPVKQR